MDEEATTRSVTKLAHEQYWITESPLTNLCNRQTNQTDHGGKGRWLESTDGRVTSTTQTVQASAGLLPTGALTKRKSTYHVTH